MSKIKFLRPKNPNTKLPDIHTGGYWPAKGKRSVVTPYERKLIEDGELVEGEDTDLHSDPSRGIFYVGDAAHTEGTPPELQPSVHQDFGANEDFGTGTDVRSNAELNRERLTGAKSGIGANVKPLSETPHEPDELDMNRSGKLGKAGKL